MSEILGIQEGIVVHHDKARDIVLWFLKYYCSKHVTTQFILRLSNMDIYADFSESSASLGAVRFICVCVCSVGYLKLTWETTLLI